MVIKILGMGWAKCNQLEKTTREAVQELSLDTTIEHVRDMKKIMDYPILATPALVINERLVCSGRLPTKAEVTTFLTKALAEQK